MLKERLSKIFKQVARPFLSVLVFGMVFALLVSGTMPKNVIANNQDAQPGVVQASFTNPTAITVTSGAANNGVPYPSSIVASGLSGTIPATPGSVKVTINNFSHTFPDDLGIVLVGPTGAALLLQDGAGDDPDMVGITYTFSDDGATVLPNLTAWAAGTYKPTTYYTGDSFPSPGPLLTYGSPGPTGGGTATFASVFGGTAPNGTWNLFVRDFVTGDAGSLAGGWTLEINTGSVVTPQHVVDFDGDGKTDPAVARNTGGGPSGQITWFIQNSGGAPASTTTPWGIATDFYVPEDYDGDGKTDVAVWRPDVPFSSYFYILQSSTGTLRTDQFGQTGDDPTVIGDYDGDNKADPAVYRSGVAAGDHSFWYYRSSINGLIIGTEWGQTFDFPAPGDYDGDGKYDFGVQRNGGGGQARFFIRQTTAGDTSFIYGTPTDVICPGDYDGDGKYDIAVIRGSVGEILWNIRRSSDGATASAVFGASATDFPTQGDWDGDGKTDIATWRPNVDPNLNFFRWRRSSDGVDVQAEWGQNGDYPIANYNSH